MDWPFLQFDLTDLTRKTRYTEVEGSREKSSPKTGSISRYVLPPAAASAAKRPWMAEIAVSEFSDHSVLLGRAVLAIYLTG